MRFEKYPLDAQVCLFKVGSYSQDDTSMKFSNRLLAYDNSGQNAILDYSVEIVPLDEKDTVNMWNSIGNYSMTGFELRLKRNILKYLINYYLPSGLFVIVSWVIIHSIILCYIMYIWDYFQASFLIPPEMVPGRMTLLVTLFLVLINIFNNITSNSPNTETMTSILVGARSAPTTLLCPRFVTYSTYTGAVKMKLQSGKIDVTSTNDEIFQICKQFIKVNLMLRSFSM
jgi:hypothetical protein